MADASSPLFRFQVWRAALPPALRTILTINVVTYVAFVVLSIFGQQGLLSLLALPGSPAEAVVQPWTVLTWGVTNLYGGIWGLISFVFGMAWLNMLGSDIEETHGAAHLVGLYVFGTLVGAALAVAVGATGAGMPDGFGAPLYFGVWGPMLALLCYVGTTSPDRPVGLFLLGEVSMKWIAIGIVVLELAFTKDPSHLGAALGGFVFALAKRRGVDLGAWARPLFRDRSQRAESRRPTGRTVGRPVPTPAPRRRATPPARPGRPTAQDVDAVLDKISASGMDSLTPEELQILKNGPRG